MKPTFETALKYVLVHEGGFVNDKDDPGGPTNKGVTQRVYDAHRRRQGQSIRSVRGITAEEVAEIYKKQYWDAIRGDDLPLGLDYAVFDFAVHSGSNRAAKELQRVLGVSMDGHIGELTLSAVEEREVIDLIQQYVDARMSFMKQIRNGGGWKKYARGWTRRVEGETLGYQKGDTGVLDRAIGLINRTPLPPPTRPVPAKALEGVREGPAESRTLQSVVVDLGAKAGVGVATFVSMDGWVQIAVLGLLCVAFVASVVIFRERLKSWANGWR